MKYLAVVLAALVSNGVFAGEVGALDSSSAPSSFDVALAEIGASDSWESRSEFSVVPVEVVDPTEVEVLDQHMATINAKINSELNELIELRIAQSLQY